MDINTLDSMIGRGEHKQPVETKDGRFVSVQCSEWHYCVANEKHVNHCPVGCTNPRTCYHRTDRPRNVLHCSHVEVGFNRKEWPTAPLGEPDSQSSGKWWVYPYLEINELLTFLKKVAKTA